MFDVIGTGLKPGHPEGIDFTQSITLPHPGLLVLALRICILHHTHDHAH